VSIAQIHLAQEKIQHESSRAALALQVPSCPSFLQHQTSNNLLQRSHEIEQVPTTLTKYNHRNAILLLSLPQSNLVEQALFSTRNLPLHPQLLLTPPLQFAAAALQKKQDASHKLQSALRGDVSSSTSSSSSSSSVRLPEHLSHMHERIVALQRRKAVADAQVWPITTQSYRDS